MGQTILEMIAKKIFLKSSEKYVTFLTKTLHNILFFPSLYRYNSNLSMGMSPSIEYAKKQKVISVISLNYSGILLSPF